MAGWLSQDTCGSSSSILPGPRRATSPLLNCAEQPAVPVTCSSTGPPVVRVPNLETYRIWFQPASSKQLPGSCPLSPLPPPLPPQGRYACHTWTTYLRSPMQTGSLPRTAISKPDGFSQARLLCLCTCIYQLLLPVGAPASKGRRYHILVAAVSLGLLGTH